MYLLHLVVERAAPPRFDAAKPQAVALSEIPCQFGALSAIVHAGRTQAACTFRWGSAVFSAPQEHRSRECRAPRSFCHFALSPLWPLVRANRKKSSMWTSRPSRLTCPLRSTDKTIGRAKGAVAPRPALFLSALCGSLRLERPGIQPWAHQGTRRGADRMRPAFALLPPLRPLCRKERPC